ncbi:exo-beta-N-acetylmuramidase NamZ family protein [Leifsonia sp. L25]|uniref:exo-beta-N-acetylmuramidase NamZ family protein n=1 Tax=Actinomycetes TaxID=1760 RepID=UPI003D6966CA
MTRTRTGAELAAENPGLLGSAPIGLLTNFTGTLPDLSRTADALVAAGAPVTVLFGPEHGLNGSVQAGETELEGYDARTDLPVVETYLKSGGALDDIVRESGVETIVFDMQDLGVRFYTYIWSMYDALESAARTGVRFVVLDRPNPLGGSVLEGPGLDTAGFESFVGRSDIHQRHGMTAGELARLFVSRDLAARGLSVELEVIGVDGWDPTSDFGATGLPWVPPSPNMPTLDTAFAFCGTGLLEGTNVSEGRGTTKPFEIFGAPWIDGRLTTRLREADIPGVLFREVWFTPTFHKYAGEVIRGAQLHVVNRRVYRPVETGLAILDALAELYPEEFWFLPPGERVDGPDGRHAIDLLWGSDQLRLTRHAGGSVGALSESSVSVDAVYGPETLLYSRQ